MQTYKTYLRIPSALVVARSNSQGIFVFKITMEKKCYTCKQVKGLDEFSNDKKGKHGKKSKCKDCFKQYRLDNRDRMVEYNKGYALKRKKAKSEQHLKNRKKIEELLDYGKDMSELNMGRILNSFLIEHESIEQYDLEYHKIKRDQQIEELEEYYKTKLNEYNKEYSSHLGTTRAEIQRIKRLVDPLFKLKMSIRNMLNCSLKNQGYSKKTKAYHIIKCDYDFLIDWLNGLASNNYNYGVGDLHIDHVVPISLAETEKETLLLNHYSNLQLLSADENFSKGNRYVNPTNLKRVLEHHPNPDKIREIHSRL